MSREGRWLGVGRAGCSSQGCPSTLHAWGAQPDSGFVLPSEVERLGRRLICSPALGLKAPQGPRAPRGRPATGCCLSRLLIQSSCLWPPCLPFPHRTPRPVFWSDRTYFRGCCMDFSQARRDLSGRVAPSGLYASGVTRLCPCSRHVRPQ